MCTTKSGGEQLGKSKNDGRFSQPPQVPPRPLRIAASRQVPSRVPQGNHHLHREVDIPHDSTVRWEESHGR